MFLRVGKGYRQYVHSFFLHGVRVQCAPGILKRGPDPRKRTKLKNFEQNIVLEFSCLEVDSGSNVKDVVDPGSNGEDMG